MGYELLSQQFSESLLEEVRDFHCGDEPWEIEVADWDQKSHAGRLRSKLDAARNSGLAISHGGRRALGYGSLGGSKWRMRKDSPARDGERYPRVRNRFAISRGAKRSPLGGALLGPDYGRPDCTRGYAGSEGFLDCSLISETCERLLFISGSAFTYFRTKAERMRRCISTWIDQVAEHYHARVTPGTANG